MRNISFSLTTEKVRRKEKDVTRRLNWLKLKVGDQLQGCKKCMGLRKDEPLVYIHKIEVVSIKREPLQALLDDRVYGRSEVDREGFPDMTIDAFIVFFLCSHKKATVSTPLTRIEFKYL